MSTRRTLTLLVFRLFPHEYISRRELFTLSRGKPAGDQWQHAQPDGLEHDMRVPRVAKI